MYHDFSYPGVLSIGSRASWQIDEVLPQDAKLDFTRPFLPEALARVAALPGLTATERLTLNHVRGHEYLAIFGLVEEFILPFVINHLHTDFAADERLRALLQFAAEEAKHIQLFERFRTTFAAGFATPCAMIGPSEEIAAEVLRHDPLSVALLILHIEWMSQRHYLESVRDDAGIEPLFANLLRHHWIEEAQHAKLDTLIVEALAARRSTAEISAAVDGYLAICQFFDDGFAAQTKLNLTAFEQAIDRSLDGATRGAFLEGQHQALRGAYLGSGMIHPNFGATLSAISPDARATVQAAALAYC